MPVNRHPGTTIVGQLFAMLAPKIGAKIVVDPEWGVAGQIVFASGDKKYFKFSTIDLNSLGSSEIAKDKDFANFFMAEMGYNIIPGQTFFSDDWAAEMRSNRTLVEAQRYATKIGYPLIIKPNSGSQGRGVARVENAEEFHHGARYIFEIDRVMLVQKPVEGRDYRIVVFDDEVICAYERSPLNIVGDGCSDISHLLARKLEELQNRGRIVSIRMDDQRIADTLRRMGLTLSSTISVGRQIRLLPNANLSAGGDMVDVTTDVHPSVNTLAIRLTKDMGLRLCGVDIMLADISKNLEKYWILEINAAPGLDHFASVGEKQKGIVENLYTRILMQMAGVKN